MKKDIYINEAHSYNDGIAFYSVRHPGHMTKTTIDYEGVIKNSYEKCDMQMNESKIVSKLSTIISIVIIVISMNDILVHVTRVVSLIDAMAGLIPIVLGTLAMKIEEKRRFAFHGAEHMVINAYNDLKRVPTLEELRRYSRLENECGTSHTFKTFVSSIFVFISTFYTTGFLRPIAIGIILFTVEMLRKNGDLNFIQYLTTSKPTDEELKVAIIALEYWIKKEQEDETE